MMSYKIIVVFLLFMVAGTASAKNSKCPFHILYRFGDGISDNGNSVRVPPFGPILPPTRDPYGVTFPGYPTGRWSDGRLEIDYVAKAVGLPNIVPYLSIDASRSYDGVVFSVAGSTSLNASFLESRGIGVPPFHIPLDTQLTWFRTFLQLNCTSQTAYDGLGCLKAVNNVAVKFNKNLLLSLLALQAEFPNVQILPTDYYETVIAQIKLKMPLGAGRRNPALRACCGVRGRRYKFDIKRLCGSPNVTSCPNPKNSIYWDGFHFTQQVYRNVVAIQIVPALLLLGCTLI
ncbi:hypothetical protein SASPL_139492 [Salvia splendens]|uniref:Alpha-L-fucosidase n=1 Tax=Salvia splendens TaxID=180675 RepID=A0A8X8ZB17_SALSN|nr:hypothetical protein SASPL_139492 [Salvia splendens]